jgi:predicted RNase H-like HicB family nuclease
LKAQIETTFNVVVERDEDGYFVGSVVELPGCHTQAKTLDKLSHRMKEAIEGYLRVTQPESMPEFVGMQQLKIRMPE